MENIYRHDYCRSWLKSGVYFSVSLCCKESRRHISSWPEAVVFVHHKIIDVGLIQRSPYFSFFQIKESDVFYSEDNKG